MEVNIALKDFLVLFLNNFDYHPIAHSIGVLSSLHATVNGLVNYKGLSRVMAFYTAWHPSISTTSVALVMMVEAPNRC